MTTQTKNTQYFRITAYHPTENLSAIFDSFGFYEKLWQFSSHLIAKGFQVIEVSAFEKFLDGNFTKSEPEPDKLILRAHHTGRPEATSFEHNGVTYPAVKVANKIYIPDKGRRV
jgi:hypothetical protein